MTPKSSWFGPRWSKAPRRTVPAEPGLLLNVYIAPAGTATADGLALLASWAAGQERLATEIQALS
ncbi:hypothetical protein GCM10009574_090980 [Streptomyces asiaticus]